MASSELIDFQFKNFVERIDSFANGDFIPVFREMTIADKDGKRREIIQAVLVPNGEVKKERNRSGWVCNFTILRPGVVRYADSPDRYARWGIESRVEPIVVQQFFNEFFPLSITS